MDNGTAKTVLGAYRTGGRDAHDPIFAEALREVERDPELAAWFEEEQRFDALVVDALGQVTAPAGLKEAILLNSRSAALPAAGARTLPLGRWRPAAAWLAVAAGFVLAFLLGRQTLPHAANSASPGDRGDDGSQRLALEAIAYTGKMPALQFVCFNAAAVVHWVEEKATAMQMGKLIDRPVGNMQMIGSSTAQWDGKPVIMIALQNGDQMAMLYLVRASDFPDAAGKDSEIMEKNGWVSKTGRNGKHVYVLTTKGTRKNLDFPMPL